MAVVHRSCPVASRHTGRTEPALLQACSASPSGAGSGSFTRVTSSWIDAVVVDVYHLELVAPVGDGVGQLGHPAQAVHHEACQGFVAAVFGQLLDVQRTQHGFHGRQAIDQPAVVVALDDLPLVVVDQIAHHRAHHVVQGDQPHHQGVFVQHDGDVVAAGAEVVEQLGQRERIRDGQHRLDPRSAPECQWLVVQDAGQQILRFHIADDAVDFLVADQEARMRQLGDLVTDLLVGLLQRQVGDALAGGHGRRHQARLQLEHVLDQVVFGIGQHTGLGAGVHHGRDVVEGEFVGALGGQPEQRNQFVRQRVEDPHQRLEHHDAAMQRTYQPAGQFFGGPAWPAAWAAGRQTARTGWSRPETTGWWTGAPARGRRRRV